MVMAYYMGCGLRNLHFIVQKNCNANQYVNLAVSYFFHVAVVALLI